MVVLVWCCLVRRCGRFSFRVVSMRCHATGVGSGRGDKVEGGIRVVPANADDFSAAGFYG